MPAAWFLTKSKEFFCAKVEKFPQKPFHAPCLVQLFPAGWPIVRVTSKAITSLSSPHRHPCDKRRLEKGINILNKQTREVVVTKFLLSSQRDHCECEYYQVRPGLVAACHRCGRHTWWGPASPRYPPTASLPRHPVLQVWSSGTEQLLNLSRTTCKVLTAVCEA